MNVIAMLTAAELSNSMQDAFSLLASLVSPPPEVTYLREWVFGTITANNKNSSNRINNLEIAAAHIIVMPDNLLLAMSNPGLDILGNSGLGFINIP